MKHCFKNFRFFLWVWVILIFSLNIFAGKITYQEKLKMTLGEWQGIGVKYWAKVKNEPLFTFKEENGHLVDLDMQKYRANDTNYQIKIIILRSQQSQWLKFEVFSEVGGKLPTKPQQVFYAAIEPHYINPWIRHVRRGPVWVTRWDISVNHESRNSMSITRNVRPNTFHPLSKNKIAYAMHYNLKKVKGVVDSSVQSKTNLPSCLINAQWSSVKIALDHLKSNRIAVKTTKGNLALMIVRASKDPKDLHILSIKLFRPSGQLIFSKKNLKIRSSWTFDVDTGIETTKDADIYWHVLSADVAFLEIQNGALIYKCK